MPNLGRREPHPPIGPAHDPLSLYRQMMDFLRWLEERNTSRHTLKHWELYLRYFVAWCDERGLTRPAEITRPILERYQRHLFLKRKKNGEPLSATTQASRATPIRKRFRWLTRNNRVLYNPAADLDLPKVEERLPMLAVA